MANGIAATVRGLCRADRAVKGPVCATKAQSSNLSCENSSHSAHSTPVAGSFSGYFRVNLRRDSSEYNNRGQRENIDETR